MVITTPHAYFRRCFTHTVMPQRVQCDSYASESEGMATRVSPLARRLPTKRPVLLPP